MEFLEKLAMSEEGSAALFDESQNFEQIDESLVYFSDTMLGLYAGCCRTDFLKKCMDFVYSAGVPYCYDRESTYNTNRKLVLLPPENSFCYKLNAKPIEYCPTNGTLGHDIPLFFESVHAKIVFVWMPIGSVLIAAGFAASISATVYMVCLCRYTHSPTNVSYSATDIDYGTPIKEPQSDVVVV